jgi:hypothetical protein
MPNTKLERLFPPRASCRAAIVLLGYQGMAILSAPWLFANVPGSPAEHSDRISKQVLQT